MRMQPVGRVCCGAEQDANLELGLSVAGMSVSWSKTISWTLLTCQEAGKKFKKNHMLK